MSILRHFIIILLLFSHIADAGQVHNVFFDNVSTVVINHQGCELEHPIKQPTQLIIPLSNCTSDTAGKIEVTHANLKKIHWQKQTETISIITLQFIKEYQHEIKLLPEQLLVCFPRCPQNSFHSKNVITPLIPSNIFFTFSGINFYVPIENFSIEHLLERSIGYMPKNFVEDGLPHFGSKRDDWLGKKNREHLGFDIYVDKTNVLAAADGRVKTVNTTKRAGLYVKLDHGGYIYTLYIHLKTVYVREGQLIKHGDKIGLIDGPQGNAKAAQLHFELKFKNSSLDPLPLMQNHYKNYPNIAQKIQQYVNLIPERVKQRDKQVQIYLLNQNK